ncbi:hypothetical protein G9P44_005440 [Scheffersomyces stipitis]|nr:hypothetical protein G9P44_005440 [Scheffersomyces stipitis]
MSDFIGQKVAIPGTSGHGILRYCGPIRGKVGIFGGVELIGPIAASRGKNSGAVDGVQYFEVEIPQTGLFLPLERLKSCNAQLAQKRERPTSSASISKETAIGVQQTKRVAGRSRSAEIKQPLAPSRSVNQQALQIQKNRVSIIGGSGRNTPVKPSSMANPSNSVEKDKQVERLEAEIQIIKSKHNQELLEKMAILNELETAVQEIQPLIGKYESELNEKDKKLLKQKQDFEKQKDEWKKTFDLMALERQDYDDQLNQRESLLETKESEIQELKNRVRGGQETQDKDTQGNAEIGQLKVQLEKAEKNVYQLELQLSNLTDMNQRLQDKVQAQAQLKKDVAMDENKERVLDLEVDQLKSQLLMKDEELAALRENYEKLTESSLSAKVNSVTLENDNRIQEELEQQRQKNIELERKVDELQHELEIRPTFDELVELQKSLDEVDELHKNALDAKSQEIEKLKENNKSLQDKVDMFTTAPVDLPSSMLTPGGVHLSDIKDDIKMDDSSPEGTLPSPSKDLTCDTNSPSTLPIYQSQMKTDPSAGKTDWCGLCERDGHSSINCPYENDIF